MAENNEMDTTTGESKSLKEMATGFFDSVKGPVFWVALGFVACKFMDRKKKTVI